MDDLERRVRAAMVANLGIKSVAVLADRAEIGPGRLYAWIRGASNLSADEVRRLAATLGLGVAELVGEGSMR